MPPATPRTRDLILSAALDAFDRRGYGATSMSDIRRATGASTGSLYHHFPSKEHVAAALFVGGLGDYQGGFTAMLAAAADAEAGIRGGVLFHLRWARRNRALARFLLGAMEAGVSEAAEGEATPSSRRFLRQVHGWLGERAARREIVELPSDLYYPVWIGPAQELTRQWLVGRTRTAVKTAESLLADQAWRSLRASGSATGPAVPHR